MISAIDFSNNFASAGLASGAAMDAAKIRSESANFSQLLSSMLEKSQGDGLFGDISPSMAAENPSSADKAAKPQGLAAASPLSREKTIDKTSRLYEKSLELENFFVKMMLSSMRSTLSGQSLGGEKSFAQKMSEDMLYDEFSAKITKNAGFGLADQIYLQLS